MAGAKGEIEGTIPVDVVIFQTADIGLEVQADGKVADPRTKRDH